MGNDHAIFRLFLPPRLGFALNITQENKCDKTLGLIEKRLQVPARFFPSFDEIP